MKSYLALFAIVCWASVAVAQSEQPYTPPRPTVSAFDLALHYINLDWSDAQVDSLAENLIELTFYVDDVGEPFLQSARGFESPAIFAKLVAATGELIYFQPARRGEARTAGEFVFWMRFPRAGLGTYSAYEVYGSPLIYGPDSLAESFTLYRRALYLDLNLFYPGHLGEVGTYLGGGIGYDMGATFRWTNRLGAGLILGLEANDRHRDFPEDPIPGRDEWSSGVFIGGRLDYLAWSRGRSFLTLQPELAYGVLNAANRLEPEAETGWVQYRGAHAGLTINFSRRLGAYRPNLTLHPDETTARYHALSAIAGLRYRYYGDKVGTGAYWFLGVGYRFGRDDFRRKN